MGSFYERFLRSQINLEPLGILPWGEHDEPYFCTPSGARPIGTTGVDGVHYCFVRGYGETVFAVSPMNEPGQCVHPVGRNFEEFLGLLAACRGEAALEQSWMWDRAQFEKFLAEDRPGEGWQETVQALADRLGVIPEQDPFACLEEIRSEVDCSGLKFSRAYRELTGEEEPEEEPWSVRYENRGREGRECRLDINFKWADRNWYIPSVYLCGKGLIVDFCMWVPADRGQAFLDKWGLNRDNEDGEAFTPQEQEQIRNENPMSLEYEPTAIVNDKELHWKGGQGGSWCGCLKGYEDCGGRGDRAWMEHYGLERDRCWSFMRYSFPWPGKRRPEIRSLAVRLEAQPMQITGAPFTVNGAGDRIVLSHPVTGSEHTLEVLEYGPEVLDDPELPGGWRCPEHIWAMRYQLEPELPREEFLLRDLSDGDRPVQTERPEPEEPAPEERQLAEDYGLESGTEADALSVIGGIDGPVAFLVADREDDRGRSALSSPRFEPAAQVEWSPVFRIRRYPAGTFYLA